MSYTFFQPIAPAPLFLKFVSRYKSVEDYFREYDCAFGTDLLRQQFPTEEIEKAVNSQFLNFAPYPEEATTVHFYWKNDAVTLRFLNEMASIAERFCYGRDATQPLGGNIKSVAEHVGSEQHAVAGLIFGRRIHLLKEYPQFSMDNSGPLYVVRNSFADQLLSNLSADDLSFAGRLHSILSGIKTK